MRLQIRIILSLLGWPGYALANDPPTAVVLADGGPTQMFSGTVRMGETKSFTYTAGTDRNVTLVIIARNEDCGAEMRSNFEHGFMPAFDRFPVTRIERAKRGEIFKVSFHQTRTAWMNKTACEYSLSIQ